jgi:betaine-aldehyde dehydrogenase
VAVIGLIGSVDAGKSVMRSASDSLKRTLLELGGKNAMVVYPDADFNKAVNGAVKGMNFTWCGQSCGSTSRLFIHADLHDRFVAELVQRIHALHRPGIATDMNTTMGAIINKPQFDRVLGFIQSAIDEGAHLACGGQRPDDAHLHAGLFIEPTVFTQVTPSMKIAQEEIFGPVLSVFHWSDESDMMQQVNATKFGLTASIWTKDLQTAHRAASAVEAGYVWINDSSAHFTGAPFGGMKQSGLGREESKEELFEFTHLKNINVSLM